MYCEKADRNCPYLDVTHDLKDDVTVWRATLQDQTEEIVAGEVENMFIEVTNENIQDCNYDYCALTGLAVVRAIEDEVQERLGKKGIVRKEQ